MFTVAFFKDAGERAVSTFVEVLLPLITFGTPLWDLDWQTGLGVAGTAALASFAKSIVASQVGDQQTASFVSTPYGRHAKVE